MSWKPFDFGVTELRSLDGVVGEDSGLIHSTRPERATGYDGLSYFVKGPELEIVFAELTGCILANAVELPVPCARVCSFQGNLLAGTRKISQVRAAIDMFISSPRLVTNHETLYDAAVVDVWLANYDRNMGNIVGTPNGGSKIDFVFIDFEKSIVLRQYPNMLAAQRAPRDFWPSEDLGRLMSERKPLFPPPGIMSRIRGMNENRCLEISAEVADALGGVPWHEDTAFVLAARAANIERLTREVWA
ncbi:hypothetical protein [Granulicella tundricola]|uniref:HipA-like C-terminal domain-containing protein n=1 Tax=Granulicella tundricola (strain ATCC BAA-1859 / DSM 23138 / MP5ACTX9) TaxID=1198114 RepID=E8WW41_GRATM|nr:hypothetical protein [Granulicella tundricola]ADW67347.1 hypothetical protein AciX9_0275 [Granulicella tundricola MP5ACTX9]